MQVVNVEGQPQRDLDEAGLAKPKQKPAELRYKRSQAVETPQIEEIPGLPESTVPPATASSRKSDPEPEPAQEPPLAEHPLYSNEVLDACLRNFLAVLDASQLRYLPNTVDPSLLPEPTPLEEWPMLVNTPASRVAKHPTIPHLYSVRAALSSSSAKVALTLLPCRYLRHILTYLCAICGN